MWDERGVLSKKVLQPHLEELRQATVSDAQPGDSAQPGEDFGCALAPVNPAFCDLMGFCASTCLKALARGRQHSLGVILLHEPFTA